MHIRNRHAFTLTELLVGLGLIIFVYYAFSQILLNFSKEKIKSEELHDYTTLIAETETYLISSQRCKEALKNRRLNPNNLNQNNGNYKIKVFTPNTSQTLLEVDPANTNKIWRTTSLQFTHLGLVQNLVNANLYMGRLSLESLSKRGQKKTWHFPLFIELDSSNRIVDCYRNKKE